jgi:hypothetical protein
MEELHTMSHAISERRSFQNVPDESVAAVKGVRSEHPSELKAQLKEREEDGKLRRWREKTFIRAFLLIAFIICAVWAIVLLSGRFSLADKQQVTDLIGKVIYGLACFLAGKNLKLSSSRRD